MERATSHVRKRCREDPTPSDGESNTRLKEALPQGGKGPGGLEKLERVQVTFGKHSGSALGEVPTSYLKWLVCSSPKAGVHNSDWLKEANPWLLRACTQLLAHRLLGVASE
jgi:hypothetical protein